jgi:CheY-like chemotaxis protein
MVIDDEVEVRLVLGEFLASRGYAVTMAESGPFDLEYLDQAISIQISANQDR